MRLGLIDYIKAIAILLVIIDHGFWIFGYTEILLLANLIGGIGVAMFFFASGYLAEHTRRQPFDGYAFLKKRLSRLYPLYISFLFITSLAFPELIVGEMWVHVLLLQTFLSPSIAYLWFVSFFVFVLLIYSIWYHSPRTAALLYIIGAVALITVGNFFALIYTLFFILGIMARRKGYLKKDCEAPPICNLISSSTYSLYLFHYPVGLMLVSFVSSESVFWCAYIALSLGVSILIQRVHDMMYRSSSIHISNIAG